MINIRPAQTSDAESLIDLFSLLQQETDFMLMEPGERKTTVQQQQAILENFSTPSYGVYLVAEDEDSKKIIATIAGMAGSANRNRHCITLMIGVLKKYSGKGLGHKLVKQHLAYSAANHFHRVELTVMSHNERAINLYKSCGFEIEGTKKDALKINGKYVNEYYMSKIV